MLPVHLRIADASTGAATPVRLRVSAPDGTPFSPLGRPFPFPPGRGEDVGGHHWLGREAWWSVSGSVEIPLPAGVPLRIQATKGPEFPPLDRTVTLATGQMALRLTIERWSDLAAEGWHGGDGRAHFVAPHAAALEAAAEDLAVVQLLAHDAAHASMDGNAYPTAPNLLAFSGTEPALPPGAPALVAVNTFHSHPVLGSVALWQTHRPVFPLRFGGPDHADDWSVSAWCEQGRRKGGLAIWAAPFRPELAGGTGEALAAALLGKIDAIECDGRPHKLPFVPGYYRLLNAGLQLPLVGASAKESNRQPLGAPRTYARLPAGEPLSLAAWADAVRTGRTVATNGPVVRFAVEGAGPGDSLAWHDAGAPFAVEATAESVASFDALEIVADGEVIAAARPAEVAGRWRAVIRDGVCRPASGWLAARALGGASPLQPEQANFAHTSPVWLSVAGGAFVPKAVAVDHLRRSLAAVADWVRDAGRFADPRRPRELLATVEAALAEMKT